MWPKHQWKIGNSEISRHFSMQLIMNFSKLHIYLMIQNTPNGIVKIRFLGTQYRHSFEAIKAK